ncbi:hypothetical protein N7486_005032 [Penicillium sp. IBT 16267x]|nr:hypothetical protein N7486_005032 [Penicillium sp. IBT 16267x]
MSFSAWMESSKLVRALYPMEIPWFTFSAACIESCVERLPNQAQSGYIKALASIMMEVMQKDVKDCGVIGIENLERWPVDSNAFKFLSAISTTKTIDALKEQPLVSKKYRLKGELILLARSVLLSAHIFYSLEQKPLTD